MSNKIKDINIKNHTYCFFNDIINIKNVDPNNLKIDENSEYIKINSVNSLYLIINKVNEYFEEINGNKYLTLDPTNARKTKKIKKYEELWSKIRDLIMSITKNSDDYDEKYLKTKFNSDDELPPNKTIEMPSMIIVVRAVLHENNKYYPHFF